MLFRFENELARGESEEDERRGGMQVWWYTDKMAQVNGLIGILQKLLKALDVTCSEIRTHTAWS